MAGSAGTTRSHRRPVLSAWVSTRISRARRNAAFAGSASGCSTSARSCRTLARRASSWPPRSAAHQQTHSRLPLGAKADFSPMLPCYVPIRPANTADWPVSGHDLHPTFRRHPAMTLGGCEHGVPRQPWPRRGWKPSTATTPCPCRTALISDVLRGVRKAESRGRQARANPQLARGPQATRRTRCHDGY